jgi:Thioesterase-like superfamily
VTTAEPFFRRDGERFVPTSATRGPWDPKSLHGRVVIGLLGREIERRFGDPAFVPARLTVDMYRLPDLSPIEVVVRPIREGSRLRLVEAELFSDGKSSARATCQFLRRTEPPPGRVWSPPNWDAPAPRDIPEPEDRRGGMGGMWATRPITGAFGDVGPRRIWMSEVRELIEGEAWTPFSRVAVAADFASPFANAGDAGLGYINSDVTLYLARLPVSEWVGFEVVDHQAGEGVAFGACALYDEVGRIGQASVAALAQRRNMG